MLPPFSPTFQQQLDVARTVVWKSTNEPTGNLHTDQGKEIMDLFAKLNDEGTTIVQVTHSREHAARDNHIIQLRDGWMEKE